jgi:hypothetical protein
LVINRLFTKLCKGLTHLLLGEEQTEGYIEWFGKCAVNMLLLNSDFLYSTLVALMAFFVGLWTLVLGVGFVLCLRDEIISPEDSLRMLSLGKE